MSKRTEDVMKQYEKKSPMAKHVLVGAEPDPGVLALADQAYAEIISGLERKLAAMVDERLASLERRVDLLYRYTVGDKTGWRYPSPPFGRGRGDEFPAPDYDHPGGPTKPPELEG